MAERGVEFKGGSLLDSFKCFGGSAEHLVLLSLILQMTVPRGSGGGLTVLAVSAVMAVSVMTATPLKLNPPFPSS